MWSAYFRTDLTVDIHSIMNTEFVRHHGTHISVTDKTKFMSTILLANAYYDIRTGTAWTPYLGGGVGFAVNQLTRNLDYSNGITDDVSLDRQPDAPTCSSPAPPWSASPTTSPPSSPST